ncbi:MAG: hypothetical protein AB2693_20100 [Candidatus Thiodiazotropha sp.]
MAQNIQPQLVGPPVPVRRTASSRMMKWAFVLRHCVISSRVPDMNVLPLIYIFSAPMYFVKSIITIALFVFIYLLIQKIPLQQYLPADTEICRGLWYGHSVII